MKFKLKVFGCLINEDDGKKVSKLMARFSNFEKTSSINSADLIIILMCSATKEVYDEALEWIEENKNDKDLILTGCIVESDKKDLSKKFKGVEIIDIKNVSKWKDKINSMKRVSSQISTPRDVDFQIEEKVQIMRGCNNFCSYCVIPYIKGREESKDLNEIITTVDRYIKNGVKEIWLLGQNVLAYKDADKNNFIKLLDEIDKINGNFWIKFHTSHPKDFDNEIIDVIKKSKKISQYLKLPIQSGSDKILNRMNRGYTTKEYLDKLNNAKEKLPNLSIVTDIIVGFPGETEKDFLDTVKVVKEINPIGSVVNIYSPRPKTKAAEMKNQIPKKIKDHRLSEIKTKLDKIAKKRVSQEVGKEAVFLAKGFKDGHLIGTTKNNLNMIVKGRKNQVGEFIKVEVIDFFDPNKNVIIFSLIGKQLT